MAHVFSVRELTLAIKNTVEAEFPFVWVRGQVSGLSRPGSGHIYFTLKDQEACLSVVWFRSNHDNAGVVGAASPVDLVDGREIVCAGRMNVYPPRGAYQLVAEFIQAEGVGRLHLEFEALKAKLLERGFFDQARKRPLPGHPCRVALVTAPTGAAIQDFLKLAGERGYGCSIRVYATLVQGDGASESIARAVDRACADGWAEVVVLIRGGGSLEDLWAFNTEAVAAAVYRATVPVVSGIGHEVDLSICDLVADVRAATPSHAAQLLWPERSVLVQEVDGLEADLKRAMAAFLAAKQSGLDTLARHLAFLSPGTKLERLSERFAREQAGLLGAVDIFLDRKAGALEKAVRGLHYCFGPRTVETRRREAEELTGRLVRAGEAFLAAKAGVLEVAAARLAGLDPEGPLKRGYGLIRTARTGRFLRDPAEVCPGDRLEIRVHKGDVSAVVVAPDGTEDSASDCQEE